MPLSSKDAMPASRRLSATTLSPLRRFELIVLFGVLTTFTPIAVDMYMPALPTIAREFGDSIAAVEHSLAAYFLGLTIGQAVVGPVSDRFGRRLPLLAGLCLYILGSVACALAQGPITRLRRHGAGARLCA
jgi:MFS family permease